MADDKVLVVYQDRIRKVQYAGEWWFAVVDVVEVLTDSPSPAPYWRMLKKKLKDEGSESVTNLYGLKMVAADGKMRTTDCANTETLLRIVQSIPSPNAEPVKRWLAAVGTERIQEEAQPGLAERRLIARYRKKGYTDEWIGRRMQSLMYRAEVVGQWMDRGAGAPPHIAALTDTLNVGGFGITTRQHKTYKDLPANGDLRDSETSLELAVTIVGEATAAELHRDRDTQGFVGLQSDCVDAGEAARKAREAIEAATGKPVLSQTNYKQLTKERQRELQPPLLGSMDDEDA